MPGAFQTWTCYGNRVGMGRERCADSYGLSVGLVPVARNLKKKKEVNLPPVYTMTLYRLCAGVDPLSFNFGIKWR